MTLQRLVLTFKQDAVTVRALYRTKHGPNPGTASRRREAWQTKEARAFLDGWERKLTDRVGGVHS